MPFSNGPPLLCVRSSHVGLLLNLLDYNSSVLGSSGVIVILYYIIGPISFATPLAARWS